MKYYLIAGEASGDLHGANLINALKAQDSKAEFRAWGGDLMAAQGAKLVKHYRELAFMGFKEVVANLGTILKNIRLCKEDILQWKPDVIIFIDYPGFNMRIAEWAKKQHIRTVYYISPQVWAWKEKRALKLKRDIDKMIVILPFEADFYQKYEYKVEYVGHPLLEAVAHYKPDPQFLQKNNLAGKPLIALLPGSRKQEIRKKLPIMLSVQRYFPEYQFVIAGAPGQDAAFYHEIMDADTPIVFGRTYALLSHSAAALVTSGTATLETALFEVPEVVCYKGSKISYEIGKRLVKVPFISLVNLIMGREVVKELIQDELTTENLKAELDKLLHDKATRQRIQKDFTELKTKLGGMGASKRAAESIYRFLREGK